MLPAKDGIGTRESVTSVPTTMRPVSDTPANDSQRPNAMPRWVVRAIAPGFAGDADRFALAVELTRITFPYLAFISLVALYGGVLNALDRFAAQASAPIILNLSLIAALLLFADRFLTPGHALAWGVAVAGVLQFLWLAMAAARAGVPLGLPRPRLTPERGGVFGLAAY